MLERFKWERVKAELAEWSPSIFAFETFLSLLLSYVTTKIVAMHWYEFIIMAVLTFGTLTTGAIAWKDYRRNRPLPWEQQMLMAEKKQRAAAVDLARMQIIDHAKGIDAGADSPEFWDWYRVVLGYLNGVCKREIVGEFESIADHTKDARACKYFLLGVSTSLTESDLRQAAPPFPQLLGASPSSST